MAKHNNPTKIHRIVACGWGGCPATRRFDQAKGWRLLVVSQYPENELAELERLLADVDILLCRAHVKQLRRLLKVTGS